MSSTTDQKPPSRLTIRIRALRRFYMWHIKSGRTPLYPMAAFPKSGGTWFCQMLAGCLDVPFARNNNKDTMATSVVHGHYLYHRNFKNVSVLFRDGRDVMVSGYYHFLFFNKRKWHKLHELNRSRLQFEDYDDIKKNLPAFIEKYMYGYYSNANPVRNNWTEFVESWSDEKHPIVRYEDLLTTPVDTLHNHFIHLLGKEIPREKIEQVVEEFSFENMTKRKRGTSAKNKFERKGISGDWKNYFTEEACEVFDRLGGDALIKAGYETNRDWIKEQAQRMKEIEESGK